MTRQRDYNIRMLNILMTSKKPVSTTQLITLLGCDRKTVYSAAATLEICGFPMEVTHDKQNYYKWTGEILGYD